MRHEYIQNAPFLSHFFADYHHKLSMKQADDYLMMDLVCDSKVSFPLLPIRPFRAFIFGFLRFSGAKCPLRPIFPLRIFLIATLFQHQRDCACAKVESLK